MYTCVSKKGYWTIISVYPPQAGCSEPEKDELYLSLDDIIRSVRRGVARETLGEIRGGLPQDKEARFGTMKYSKS
ncbi:unnamed protein product [Haemonchus placei]|uniref:Uncharacterized protein n=1 Tax=Haemonchus placei TaxID=6290 RepID=A0A0N4WCQ8_HAEPC|nr:unnamed protein product [Haemonchus placei]